MFGGWDGTGTRRSQAPKRLSYFLQRDEAVLNMVLRIFLRVIAQSLQSNSPGVAQLDNADQHIGAIAFIHSFGSSLNGHVHFHVCVVDGVFEEVLDDDWTCSILPFVTGKLRCGAAQPKRIDPPFG